MPRAGAGGGSSHQSGGHSSSPHSSGGHRVGNSSRPGSGGSQRAGGGFSGGFGGGARPNPTPPPRNHGGMGTPPPPPHRGPVMPPPPRNGRGRRPYGGGCLSSIVGSVAALVMVIVILIASVGACSSNAVRKNSGYDNNVTSSVSTRDKITTSEGFDSDCIVDELGWFDNVKSASKSLKSFYEKTGVQPYVVLLGYDGSLASDSAKSDFANSYYNEKIGDEDSFLFMYFAEENQDEDVGYMCYVCGNNARTVMDSEAVSVFWDNIDKYWYSDLSTDEMFKTVFNETADKIMNTASSSNGKASGGALKVVRIVVLIVVVGVVVVFVVKKRREKNSSSLDASGEKNPNVLN